MDMTELLFMGRAGLRFSLQFFFFLDYVVVQCLFIVFLSGVWGKNVY